MTDLISLLAVFYLCEASAELRLLPPGEAERCSVTFQSVKAHFIDEPTLARPGTAERLRQNTAAYLAFKRWEAENATLVSALKQAARIEARETPVRAEQPL